MTDTQHSTALQLMRDSGNIVDLLIKRKVFLPDPSDSHELSYTLDKMKNQGEFSSEMAKNYFTISGVQYRVADSSL